MIKEKVYSENKQHEIIQNFKYYKEQTYNNYTTLKHLQL